jgi:GntR family transcriptional regulator/MocR family aminotransferase
VGEAGLHSVLWLTEGSDDLAAAGRARARAAGLACPALSEYRRQPGPPGLVLGWGNIREERMEAVVARLARALA